VKPSNILATQTPRLLASVLGVLTLSVAGCSEEDPDQPLQVSPGTSMSGVGGSTAGGSTGATVGTGGGTGGTSSGATGADGATGTTSGGGMAAMPGGTGMGGTAGGMTAGDAGLYPSHDHCKDGYPVDPRDQQISSKPDQWKASNGDIDLVLPKGVLDFMHDSVWEQSHDAWHNIRRCGGGGFIGGAGGLFGGAGGFFGGSGSGVDVCSHTELVPEDQECENASDGYQFLVMHRHMIQALKQSFPTHADLLNGFTKFPRQASDVPPEWQSRWSPWPQAVLDMADRMENIEQNLNDPAFATEGDLGKFIQCTGAGSSPSLHGALHFKWVVGQSPYSLGTQAVNIDNYMFWKLHGWIDDVWERYRKAKGLADNEPKLTQALYDQCYEMHQLGHLFNSAVTPPASTDPLPVEHGYFHEQVRPILDKYCSSCHSGSGAQANLWLGGQISSAMIVQNLVGAPTLFGGQFKRVVAGDPNQSWLYLKVAGLAANAGCSGTTCNAEVMPPASDKPTLSSAELGIIKKWISDGAPAPTL
jgi:hypothetical protein